MVIKRLGTVAAAALLVAVLAPSASARTPGCPYERTCAAYKQSTDARFASAPGGLVRIEYYLNPLGATTLTEQQLVGIMRAATAVWERANPRLRFVYKGTTTTPPGIPDGKNVVGFGVPAFPWALGESSTSTSGGRMIDADIVFNASIAWSWEPCQQKNGSCGRRAPRDIAFMPEIQGIATHELGHWLSLDHPNQEDGVRQTMAVIGSGDLSAQTLALGDIVGVRAMYPCGKCGGRPVVYVP